MTNSSTNDFVSNIQSVYDSRTTDQNDEGMAWYANARFIAESFSANTPFTLNQCAGVIAALSPLNSWGRNLVLAANFIENSGNVHSGYLSLGLDKARSILNIMHEDQIPVILNSNKIRNFYDCIVYAGFTDRVCIDRHAISIAHNSRFTATNTPKLTDKQYHNLANAYCEVAENNNIYPAHLQAITWVVWRNRFWSKGAWD